MKLYCDMTVEGRSTEVRREDRSRVAAGKRAPTSKNKRSIARQRSVSYAVQPEAT
jgi:hypothetical protein